MANQSNEGFTDNCAYLKTELSWLDRMLMMALSRYRQDKKEVDRVAQSKADKASSHWWKGVISLDGKVAYDEHRPNTKMSTGKTTSASKSSTQAAQSTKVTLSTVKPGYQQQLDARLKITRSNGVILALPWLRDRLKLTLFEKNLVLMALAPEVNRRYARLYRYLQSQDDNPVTDLPTVELVLRLLCRNDMEWRRARTAFHPDAPLMRHGLLMVLNDSHDPFLNATLRLSDDCVDCLLAETPDSVLMEELLSPPASTLAPHPQWPISGQLPVEFSHGLLNPEVPAAPANSIKANQTAHLADPPSLEQSEEVVIGDRQNPVDSSEANVSSQPHSQTADDTNGSTPTHRLTWDDLIISSATKTSLQHLGHRLALYDTVKQKWSGSHSSIKTVQPGLVTLFTGPSGTGKTLASRVLAHELTATVYCVDLAGVMDIDYFQLLEEIENSSPTVLLLQAAEQWLDRTSSMPRSRLTHFLAQRHKQAGLTIFSVDYEESVAPCWHQYIDQSILFPLPDKGERLVLWQQAFPAKLKFSVKIDWTVLSQIPLKGDEIEAIAHDAMIRLLADGSASLKLDHLVAALQWHQVSDLTIETFIQDSQFARKQALAAKAKRKAKTLPTKASPSRSSKTKATAKKTTRKKAAGKRTRTPKTSKTKLDEAMLSDPLMPETAEPSTTTDGAIAPAQTSKAQTPAPVDSAVETPTS